MFALDVHSHPTPFQQEGAFPWQRTIINFHWLWLLWYQLGVCLSVSVCAQEGWLGGGFGDSSGEEEEEQGDLMKGAEWENAPADPQFTNRREDHIRGRSFVCVLLSVLRFHSPSFSHRLHLFLLLFISSFFLICIYIYQWSSPPPPPLFTII